MPHRLLVLFAETPVHAGASGSFGLVDQPIQREATTRLPVIWGQSLKGALRDAARGDTAADGWVERIFGSKPPGQGDQVDNGELTKGGVSFGDAQLLLFPAPTMRNTFAWVTSRLVLDRLSRKVALTGAGTPKALTVAEPAKEVFAAGQGWSGRQLVGPFLGSVMPTPAATALSASLADLVFPDHADVFAAAHAKMREDVILVRDDVLSELTVTGTDVVARVRLKIDSKTADDGGLFHSEHLPTESVLVSVLSGPEDQLAVLERMLDGQPIQIGGDETIGKGVMWCGVRDQAALTRLFSADAPAGVR